MESEALWAAVAALTAIVSLAAAGVSWYRSNLSRQARADAETARDAAERHLEAAERHAAAAAEQAHHLERIHQSVERLSATPPLTLQPLPTTGYRLTNNTDRAVTVEQIDNREEFAFLHLEDGTEIGARRSVDFVMEGAWGNALPPQLEIGLVGEDAPITITIPPK